MAIVRPDTKAVVQRKNSRMLLSSECEIARSQEMVEAGENEFCHHCKQLRTTYIMAQCRYNSKKHGLFMPTVQSAGGVQVHNVEPR